MEWGVVVAIATPIALLLIYLDNLSIVALFLAAILEKLLDATIQQ